MGDHEQAGVLDSLLTPLTLPRRAAKDLEAIGTAARGLPAFERQLLAHLDELGADVRETGVELHDAMARVLEEMGRLDQRVAALQTEVPELNRNLAATRSHVAELKDQVSEAVALLPDPDSRGPIARARDALAGTEPRREE
jgi:hypothetical protein